MLCKLTKILHVLYAISEICAGYSVMHMSNEQRESDCSSFRADANLIEFLLPIWIEWKWCRKLDRPKIPYWRSFLELNNENKDFLKDDFTIIY